MLKEIILIENDDATAKTITLQLNKFGIDVQHFCNAQKALDSAQELKNKLLIIDYRLDIINAYNFVVSLKEILDDQFFFIIYSVMEEPAIALEMFKLGAIDYLIKSLHSAEYLPIAIEKAFKHIKMTQDSKQLSLINSELEAKYNLIFEKTQDMILFADSKTGVIVDCNSVAEDILERNRNEIIGEHLSKFHPDSVKEPISNTFIRVVENRFSNIVESSIITKSGKIKPVSISPALTEIGSKNIVIGVFRDLSNIQNLENRLVYGQQTLTNYIHSLNSIALLLDGDGKIIELNSFAIFDLGIKRNIALGKDYWNIVPTERKEIVKEQFEILKQTRSATQYSAYYDNQFYEVSLIPILAQDDSITNIVVNINDMSEIYNVASRDKRTLQLYDNITDTTNIIIIQIKIDGTVTFVNKAAQQFLRITNNNFASFNIFSLITDVHTAHINETIEHLKKTKKFEYYIYEKDEHHYKFLCFPNFDSKFELESINIYSYDVSNFFELQSEFEDSRKIMLNTVKESESIRYALDQHAIVAITDIKGRITYANKQFQEISKYNYEELIGSDHRILNSGFHPKSFFKDMWTTIQKGEIWQNEIRNKAKDNSFYWVKTTIVPIRDTNNQMTKFVSIREDITKQKKVEEELREAEFNYRTVADYASNFEWWEDEKGVLKYVSPSSIDITGFRKEEFFANPNLFKEIIVPEDLEIWLNYRSNLVPDAPGQPIEIRIQRADSTIIWLEHTSKIIKDTTGKIIGIRSANKDVTTVKIAEGEMFALIDQLMQSKIQIERDARALSELNDKLSDSESQLIELNKSKDRFFSIIAHDLKSPFTGFLGLTDLMMNNGKNLKSEDIVTLGASMNKSANNLYKLLENLLDWARIQSGNMDFEPIDFDLSSLVDDNISLQTDNLKRKQITIRNNIESILLVNADVKMIDTILRNLISNAIKFTNIGGNIEVNYKIEKSNETAIISICDNGVGMSEDIASKLFSIEQHFTTKGTAKESGTGLGLILCKDLIERNGGKIWVESESKIGSKFFFTINLF